MFNVLVTGANRGIGLEFVVQLLRNESVNKVLATTRSTSPVLNDLAKTNSKLVILELDVSEWDQHEKFAEQVRQIVGSQGLDTLINNAGITIRAEFADITGDQFVEVYRTNAVSPLLLTRALLPVLKQASSQRKTLVVNISSFLGSISSNTMGGWYAYRPSKAALNMLSVNLALELKADNIAVLIVHPGHVRTDMGGPTGQLDATTSVEGMLAVMGKSGLESTGRFVNWKDEDLAW